MAWIDDPTGKHVALCQSVIRSKAQGLFNNLEARNGSVVLNTEWFDRFKRTHNIKMQVRR